MFLLLYLGKYLNLKVIMNSIIVNSFSKIDSNKNSIVTIGKFDGVHKGHQKLLRYVSEKAKKNDLLSIAIVLKKKNQTIYDFDENIEHIKFLGINYIIVIDFSEKFYKMTSDVFFSNLIENYKMVSIATGPDFMFGNNKVGDVNLLREYGNKNNVQVNIVEFSTYKKEKISTTNIFKYLELGDILSASKMLKRDYILSGIVELGKKIGRTIGFPTANLYIADKVFMPRAGVYFGIVCVDGFKEVYKAMIFIGSSNLNKGVRLEAHLLDFNDDLYGKVIYIKLMKYSRENIKLESFEDLKELLKTDKMNAFRYFKGKVLEFDDK